MNDEDNIPNYKIVFMGESGVGKTSIINKYIKDKFDENVNATAGVGFFTHKFNIPEKNETFKLDVIITFLINNKIKLYSYGIQPAKKDIKV